MPVFVEKSHGFNENLIDCLESFFEDAIAYCRNHNSNYVLVQNISLDKGKR